MKLKSTDLPLRLQASQVPEAILLFGEDQGLVASSALSIRQTTFPEESADFDLETFFGGDLDRERFSSSCQAYPLSAPRRLVILKEADRLSAAAAKSIVEYLQRPSSTTLLLIMAGNLEAKNPLRKHCETSKSIWCIPFYPLEEHALRQWLQTQLHQEGFQVERDALQYLSDHLAGDTRNTQQELDKLALYMGRKKRIALEDVLAMVGETTKHSSFGLSAAITSGKLEDALYILDRLLESGEEPLMLLGVISQRLRRLNQCRELLDQGQNPKIVAGRLRIFWKEQAPFFSQSRAIPAPRLADGLLECLEADKQLKGGSILPSLPPRLIMERFVMRLTSCLSKR